MSFEGVTTGLSLAAFIVSVSFLVVRQHHNERLRAIEKASADDAAQLVNGTLTAFKLNTEGLTKEQRFTLAREELQRLRGRQTSFAFLVGIAAVILAIIAVAAIFRQEVATAFEDDLQNRLKSEIRRGTPAERAAAIEQIKNSEMEKKEWITWMGDQLGHARDDELCNIMLAVYELDSTLDESLRTRYGEQSEYIIESPSCSLRLAPNFSGKSFQNLGIEKPKLSDTNFTRAKWDAVSLRDRPDYAGQGQSDCRLTEISFNGARLSNSSFSGCHLHHVSFNSAQLEHVNFHRTKLERVDFRYSTTTELRFLSANLSHVDLRGVNDVTFALAVETTHLRMDFGLARTIQTWPRLFDSPTCVSDGAASQCWDLLNEDNPECPSLSRSGIYIVYADNGEQCRAWAGSI